MTVLSKLSLQTAAIAIVLVAGTAGKDIYAASTLLLPPIRFEVGMTRVQHQKVVIKNVLRERPSLLWGMAVHPSEHDDALKQLFQKDDGNDAMLRFYLVAPTGPTAANQANSPKTLDATPVASGAKDLSERLG
jgi:hypothetical protein